MTKLDLNQKRFELKILADKLDSLGLEQVSDISISPTRRNSNQINMSSTKFTDNIMYAIKDFFLIKQLSQKEEYYIRSNGGMETNILLYSHFKKILEEGKGGVFSVGKALNKTGDEIELCICHVWKETSSSFDFLLSENLYRTEHMDSNIFGKLATTFFVEIL